ncbi:MAG: DUF4954 family protein [Chitinophagaceae bacterium]|nr:DUF4954 family protein [Chitinophagaceae bacterium]
MKNNILKIPISKLGYGFIEPSFLPEGKDEYYLRNLQNRNGITYRQLTAYEIEILVRNGNTSDNWNNILVSDAFAPELVKNCKFFGLVRIGKLEPYFLEYSRLRVPVGLYNSTIISCDFGDNVVVDNVNYMSHYIIGSEAIIINVNELMTTPHAKFGNGIIKSGEPEDIRIWMEICNENGGRRVIPFNGMLPGDAWIWAKYRENEALLSKLKEFTEEQFDTKRGYYGKVGDRTVIKNCAIIKDVWIGSDAYLKGANKLKNLTINSKPEAKTQIGEGCEMVNGIVGFGCRAFYGVKAVRFVMSSNSQLKYGARLINAYLGDNATISCCEVLNSLIFPAHEQHHNNSFLCAAVVMGQSNMAAGATIGSNHNSRSNDGEILANRGFWPGLCVSLKHNSRFAAFTIIAKGDYPAEIHLRLPFSLLSQDPGKDALMIMPAYWFMYNMYALGRNAWKYKNRDRRPDKIQHIEYNYMAPDTANEILEAITLLQLYAGKSVADQTGEKIKSDEELKILGKNYLEGKDAELEIVATDVENSPRKVIILKARKAYRIYKKVLLTYCMEVVADYCTEKRITDFEDFVVEIPKRNKNTDWMNIGGQLIPSVNVTKTIENITQGKIKNWEQVHNWYKQEALAYPDKKLKHVWAVLKDLEGAEPSSFPQEKWRALAAEAINTRKQLSEGVYLSRQKDYTNPYRKMMYASPAEMEKVLGKLDENEFILQEKEDLSMFLRKMNFMQKRIFNQAK